MSGTPEAAQAGARLHLRPPLRLALLAGVTIVTLGMAMTVAGVLVGPLFLPGVYLIGLGLLVLAATGVAAIVLQSSAAPVAARRPPGGSRHG